MTSAGKISRLVLNLLANFHAVEQNLSFLAVKIARRQVILPQGSYAKR